MDHGLPEGWVIRESGSRGGLPYYFNESLPDTQRSQWELPLDTNYEKLVPYWDKFYPQFPVPNAPVAKPAKVRAAHLLVKHRDSRRASSWREAEITRSKEEAREILQEYESRIKSGSISLGDLATTESDCTSARKFGDLGFFEKGQMQKEFETAAFALQVGQMSSIVDTASGLHLIERYVLILESLP